MGRESRPKEKKLLQVLLELGWQPMAEHYRVQVRILALACGIGCVGKTTRVATRLSQLHRQPRAVARIRALVALQCPLVLLLSADAANARRQRMIHTIRISRKMPKTARRHTTRTIQE